MAPQKRVRYDEDEEVTTVQSASSALRPGRLNKRARLSSAHSASESRQQSASPSSESESDEELPDAIEDNGQEAPPTTQYESIRDADWRHLANPDLDDAIAEKRILAKNRRVGENRASENAIIEEITCYNFMCHTRLNCKLGPLINFVVGMNGSGKSAVLTAITLCLGGKAAATNRGASLKSLIKEGTESAKLEIRLKNEGNDAYQPDIYGKSIIIERHFSKAGSSGFKLKNHAGRIISSKKGDVDDLVEYYQLQVDNPMNVLTQDAAKSFITASTPAQKYKFFVEGVQLEALNNDYKIVLDTCEQIDTRLQDSIDDIKHLKKSLDDAQAKHKAVNERNEMKSELRRLGGKHAWSQVRDQEVKLAEIDQKLVDHQQQINDAEAKVTEKDENFQKAEDLLTRHKDACTQLQDELPALKEEEEKARSVHETATKDVAAIHTQHKIISDDLKSALKSVKAVQDAIKAEEKRLEDANGGAHAQKVQDLAEAKETLENARAEFLRSEEARPQLDENLRSASATARNLETPLQQRTEEFNNAKTKLTHLDSNQGDQLAGFDRVMAGVLQIIQNDRGFREKPVGPVGLHIKLLQPKWSNAIESKMGAALSGFVVTSKPDQLRLSDILRKNKMGWCPVSIVNGPPLDLSGNEPDPQYDTIYRVMSIDNELVKRQLIIGHAIEQTILIESRSQAIGVMYDGPRPRNVRQCFAMHDSKRGFGHQLSFGPRNSRELAPIHPPKGRPKMRTDRASQLNNQREIVDHLERQKKTLADEYERARQEAGRCKAAIQQHVRENKTLKIACQKAEAKVEDIEGDLQNLGGDDGQLDSLKQELESAEKQKAICEDAYGGASLEKQHQNSISTEKKRALDASRARVVELEAQILKARDKVNRTEKVRNHCLSAKNLAVESFEDLERKKIQIEEERTAQAKSIAEDFVVQAEKYGPRVQLGPGDTTKALEKRCESLHSQLSAYERAQGGTDQEIHEAAIEALNIFRNAKRQRKGLEELLSLLKQSFVDRMEQFRKFQRHISARSRISFSYLLSERAFRGKLTIDHKAKLLDVHVEPDETSRSGKGRQTKTLSGGEKSFSSICLLLSLWEAMGAPLRCLDEFDVFMDDVNRDVSTKMIISAARKAVGRQFILITPKALGAGIGKADDVRITKLLDPRLNQKQIDEMIQRQRDDEAGD
ncbi:hypothetical protein LZ554_003845 [Drepanopeziza brunnea f. sp. 'monogermtubi']|nr:hypothetical protein LZ554_003845 [Drepanopeziza brunnea f. sp. 'monogermtubi']